MDIPIHPSFKNHLKIITEIFPYNHPKIESFAYVSTQFDTILVWL